jgi:hypothetical protein
MDIIIKISALYGISFLIAMFVASIIWLLYQVFSESKFSKGARNLLKRNSASSKQTGDATINS